MSNAASKRYYERNKAAVKARVIAYRKRNPLMRVKHRNAMTEIPPPAGAYCSCCGREFGIDRFTKPHADHCHLTGLFRGWICSKCNLALGLMSDTPEGVRKLLSYVTTAYDRINQRILS